MTRESPSLELRLKKVCETKNYLLDEIKHNDLMSKKHKKMCKALISVENILILISAFNDCVPLFAFASLVDIPLTIASSEAGLKICAITAGTKKSKSIIKEKKKSKSNAIKILIFKASSDSYITHKEFVLINNVLKEFNETKEEIKNSKTSVEYIR